MRRKTDVFGTMCKVMAWTLATTALTGLGAARVDVGERAIKTYPFGDPDPIPATGSTWTASPTAFPSASTTRVPNIWP